jgi:hypothetical protein
MQRIHQILAGAIAVTWLWASPCGANAPEQADSERCEAAAAALSYVVPRLPRKPIILEPHDGQPFPIAWTGDGVSEAMDD